MRQLNSGTRHQHEPECNDTGVTVLCVCGCVCVSEEANTERACDTLLMCIVTVMNHGLRNGGGVGDVLRKPSKNVNKASFFVQSSEFV